MVCFQGDLLALLGTEVPFGPNGEAFEQLQSRRVQPGELRVWQWVQPAGEYGATLRRVWPAA